MWWWFPEIPASTSTKETNPSSSSMKYGLLAVAEESIVVPSSQSGERERERKIEDEREKREESWNCEGVERSFIKGKSGVKELREKIGPQPTAGFRVNPLEQNAST